MKNLFKILTAFFAVMLISGSAFAQVNSDYDKNYDFSQVKTYKFIGWEKNSQTNIPASDVKAIQTSMKNELDARGLTMVSDNADLEVSLFSVIEGRESKTAYTDYMGSYGYGGPRWGWGRGYWAGPSGGMSTTNIDVEYYNEGTLVVDFFDTDSKQLVYEGLIKAEINDNASKRIKKMPKAVKKIMKKFPIKKQ